MSEPIENADEIIAAIRAAVVSPTAERAAHLEGLAVKRALQEFKYQEMRDLRDWLVQHGHLFTDSSSETVVREQEVSDEASEQQAVPVREGHVQPVPGG